MSLKDYVVDNPEDYDRLLIPKSEVENDGNARGKDPEEAQDHEPESKDSAQNEEKQEDKNILWQGSNHK